MKKTFRKILIVSLVGMLFLSSSQAAFTKFVFENSTSSHLNINKEKHSSTITFFQNGLAEELVEEKNDDESPDDSDKNHLSHSPQSNVFQSNFSQLDFDFLKIKSLLFRQLFLLFHCLKIPCI